MEGLQLAQMLADLSSLNATEPNAAAALVTANKAIETVENEHPQTLAIPGKRPIDDLRRANSAQNLSRGGAASSPSSPPAEGPPGTNSAPAPVRHDKFGRRILTSPPLSRTNSSHGVPFGAGVGTSTPGTPRRETDSEDDLDRASTLMALYDIRAKLKQQDNSSLMKAREKIADLAAKQHGHAAGHGNGHGQSTQQGARNDGPRYSYPRA